jgi:hypothetical protein
MMDKSIKFTAIGRNFHANISEFGFFSEFRVVNRLWLLAFGSHTKKYTFSTCHKAAISQ